MFGSYLGRSEAMHEVVLHPLVKDKNIQNGFVMVVEALLKEFWP